MKTDGEPDVASPNETLMGDKCRYHAYYVAPGESVSATFETVVDAILANIAGEEQPTLQKEQLEAANYSISYSSHSVDTFTANFPVWVVTETDFIPKGNEQVHYTPANGIYIDWNRQGEGTIVGVTGATGKYAVGKVSLDKIIGTKGAIMIKAVGGKEYSLIPTQRHISEEFHVLSATLDIKAPEKPATKGYTTHGELLWKNKGIKFNGRWEQKMNKYVISGPATGRECFE